VPFSRKTPAVAVSPSCCATGPGSLINRRLVHLRVRLRASTRAWLHVCNINNVLLDGIIDFDLFIIRLTGDGSWTDHHLIYCKKLMSGAPVAPGLTCRYCPTCVNGVSVPAHVDPGCPTSMFTCACVSGCDSQAPGPVPVPTPGPAPVPVPTPGPAPVPGPPPSSGSSVLSWICIICSILCCILILMSASSGSGGSLATGFILGDILGSLTR